MINLVSFEVSDIVLQEVRYTMKRTVDKSEDT